MRNIFAILIALPLFFAATLPAQEQQEVPEGFERYTCRDDAGLGGPAFSLLIPRGWSFEGGIRWNPASLCAPAVVELSVSGSDGERLRTLPPETFVWVEGGYVTSYFRPGGNYMGIEIQPPQSAVGYLEEILIAQPCEEGGEIEVVESESLPGLAEELGVEAEAVPWFETSLDGGRIRLAYEEGGQRFEEIVYAVVQRIDVPLSGWPEGNASYTIWTADYIHSFRAPAGRLGDLEPTFRRMVASFELNPVWLIRYRQLVGMNAYYANLASRERALLGQYYIYRTNSEISDMIMDSWERRQRTMDRIFRNYSDYIRGPDERHRQP